MQIFPVLDLLEGLVVRGVAGERQHYRPIQSQLVQSSQPRDIALAFREQFGLRTLYIADLDAILSNRPNLNCYRQLAEAGFELMIDAGVRDLPSAEQVRKSGASILIAGLETIPGPACLTELCERFGPARVLFSLDLKQGQPLSDSRAWGQRDPLELVDAAVACGITQLIVLDLAQVGVGAGVGTIELCAKIRQRYPALRIITGGGIRNSADLLTLQSAGIEGVLVASALHNGQLSPADVRQIHQPREPGVP